MPKISSYFQESTSLHEFSVYEDELLNRLSIGSVDSLINYYHLVSYVRKTRGLEVLRDDYWELLCDYIYEHIGEASKFHQKTIVLEDVGEYKCNLELPDGLFKPGKTFHPQSETILEDLNSSLEITGSYQET